MDTTPLLTEQADAERTAAQMRMLRELAEIGMEIARCIRASAQSLRHAPNTKSDHDIRFERVARAVRQALALEACLGQGLHIRAAERAARRAAAASAHAADQKQRLRRLIAPAMANADTRGANAARALRIRFDDHIADPFLDEELARRSLPEIVDRICENLGIVADRTNWPDDMKHPGPAAPHPDRPPTAPPLPPLPPPPSQADGHPAPD